MNNQTDAKSLIPKAGVIRGNTEDSERQFIKSTRKEMVISDVIEAILVRCVVKDLLRSKSVCKSWYSLISSPSFAKTHAKFICNKEEDNTRKIAMITSYFHKSGSRVEVPSEWRFYNRWFMQGSCNGLVCINSGGGGRIFVTNPVTREFRELQQPPKRGPGEMRCMGFGYDSSSDDYKVVMASSQGNDKSLVRILSLKSNIWKVFGQVNYRFDDSTLAKTGILFNGALHWFWLNPNDATRESILLVSFNLAKEEFREIPQPDDTRYVWNYGYRLGIIEGRLCIFPAYKEHAFPSCGIWVMKSYNSWELFPKDREIKDHAIHYMLKDTNEYRITPPPTYFCDENIQLSRSKEHITSPMFVQTLVSPYVYNNNNGGPSHAKNNKSTANAGSVQEKKEIEEVYSVEDKEEESKSSLLEVEAGLGLNQKIDKEEESKSSLLEVEAGAGAEPED